MKVVYHRKYMEDYPTASCECPERMLAILESLRGYEIITPESIAEKGLELIHGLAHIQRVKNNYPAVYEVATYSAGGAVRAAEISLNEPAFGLIRPPGHHASRDSAWGFCFFNNMALTLKMLREHSLIDRALVLDIDLHFGDGTVNILGNEPWVTIHNTRAVDRKDFVDEVEEALEEEEYDIVGVSAGFDTYEKDWGGILTTEDYSTIGECVKTHSERRFALLEGGYYIPDLGKNVRAFVEGFSD
jgi:acetoin utilization deacetylase AcuC-like enzyme